jgi:hypothetical protein
MPSKIESGTCAIAVLTDRRVTMRALIGRVNIGTLRRDRGGIEERRV